MQKSLTRFHKKPRMQKRQRLVSWEALCSFSSGASFTPNGKSFGVKTTWATKSLPKSTRLERVFRRDASGIKRPTPEGLHTLTCTHTHTHTRVHTHRGIHHHVLVLGPSLPPRHSSSWNPLHCCTLKLYTTQCKIHRAEVQQHIAMKGKRAPREGADYRPLRTLEGDGLFSEIVSGDFSSLAQPSSSNRETERELCLFSFLFFWPGHVSSSLLALSCSRQGHSLASRWSLNCPLDGTPEAAHAQTKCTLPCPQEMPSTH